MKKNLKLLSLSNITILSFLVYSLPLLFMIIKGGPVLKEFYPVQIRFPGSALVIILINFLLLWFLVRKVPSFKFNNLRLERLPFLSLFLIIAITFLSLYSLTVLIIKLELISNVIYPLLRFDLNFAVNSINHIGWKIGNLGLAKYYLFSQLLLVVLIILLNRSYQKLYKILFTFIYVMVVLLYFLMSRREVLLLAVLLYLAYRINKNKNKEWNLLSLKNIILFSVLLILIVLTVMFRTGNYSISGYLESQEFYPFLYGSYLIGEDLWDFLHGKFEFYPILEIGFWNILFDKPGLSSNMSFLYFGLDYGSYGPTVSINYALFKYGYILPLFLFIIYIRFHKAILNMVYKGSFVALTWYIYLSIKWFFLIRNGEIALWWWDILISFILFLPLLISESRGEKNGE